MAKVSFTKLKCKINDNEIPVQIGEETIAVKQYLPIQDKLNLISDTIMLSHEISQNYSNPVKAKTCMLLGMVFSYTNISFTEKQKEDLPKLYDQLYSSGVLNKIIKAIPEEEYNLIERGVEDTIESVYKYQNSVLGVLDTIKTDYSDINFDMTNLQEALKGEDFTMLKNVLTKLG